MVKVLAIPYKNFREKIKITKEYSKKKAKIQVFNDYIFIELQKAEKDGHAKKLMY